jgi:predicted Zn-dependent protease
MGISLLFAVCLIATPALGSSSPKKRSKSDRDIGAIGHRKIANVDPTRYSPEREKQIGAQWSASFERSTPLLSGPTIAAYVERLAHTVVQNSDAQQIPITVRIIDSEEVYAFTFPAGYQYITRGLLLRIGSEGELASVLARGIAHTALRSAIRESTKEAVARIATTPLIFGPSDKNTPPSSSTVRWLLKTKWEDELDADYFGLQYLYKSGYDPECFLNFVQTAWPADPSGKPAATSLSQFPPLSERLKALQEEISDVLPKRDGAVTNTPGFADFREHLLKLNPPKVGTKSESKPVPTPPQP